MTSGVIRGVTNPASATCLRGAVARHTYRRLRQPWQQRTRPQQQALLSRPAARAAVTSNSTSRLAASVPAVVWIGGRVACSLANSRVGWRLRCAHNRQARGAQAGGPAAARCPQAASSPPLESRRRREAEKITCPAPSRSVVHSTYPPGLSIYTPLLAPLHPLVRSLTPPAAASAHGILPRELPRCLLVALPVCLVDVRDLGHLAGGREVRVGGRGRAGAVLRRMQRRGSW
jgi:hypothetical protein